MNEFVVVTNRRSGSTLLMNLLQSHPQIFAQHETMGSAKRSTATLEWVTGELDRFYDIKALGLVSDKTVSFKGMPVQAPSSGEPKKAAGWKVLYEQMYQPLADYIAKRNLKIIHLIRNDLLDTALWTRTATAYDARYQNLFEKYGKVKVNIDETLEYIELLRKNIDYWAKKADFSLFYEGELTNHSENVTGFYNASKSLKLQEFLGVDYKTLVTVTEKKVKLVHESSEVVSNWDELLSEMAKRGILRYYVTR